MSYMIASILFYLIPVLILVTFVVSLTLFLVENGKKKREDPAYQPQKQKTAKILMIASGVVLGIMFLVVIGLFLNKFLKVRFVQSREIDATRINNTDGFCDFGDGFQIVQSLYAIGSGGF